MECRCDKKQRDQPDKPLLVSNGQAAGCFCKVCTDELHLRAEAWQIWLQQTEYGAVEELLQAVSSGYAPLWANHTIDLHAVSNDSMPTQWLMKYQECSV